MSDLCRDVGLAPRVHKACPLLTGPLLLADIFFVLTVSVYILVSTLITPIYGHITREARESPSMPYPPKFVLSHVSVQYTLCQFTSGALRLAFFV